MRATGFAIALTVVGYLSNFPLVSMVIMLVCLLLIALIEVRHVKVRH